MSKLFTKIDAIFLFAVLIVFYGCGQSAEKDEKQKIEPIPISIPVPTAANDGLSPVDFDITAGTNFVTGGTGTMSKNSESLSVNVPQGATIEKIYLYWERKDDEDSPAPSKIEVNGVVYEGRMIGGPVHTASDNIMSGITYRLNLTGKINMGVGINTVSIKDKPPAPASPGGASLIVFYTSKSEKSELSLYDGVDFFWARATAQDDKEQQALRQADPITFTFNASENKRNAKLTLLVGDEGTGANSFKYEVGDSTTSKIASPGPFQAADGEQWDNYSKMITIPAGAQSVTVFPISGPGDDPASLIWIFAGLSVPVSQ